MIRKSHIDVYSRFDAIPKDVLLYMTQPDSITLSAHNCLQSVVELRARHIFEEIIQTLCDCHFQGGWGFDNGLEMYSDQCSDGTFLYHEYDETVRFYGDVITGVSKYHPWIKDIGYIKTMSFPTEFLSMTRVEWTNVVQTEIDKLCTQHEQLLAKRKSDTEKRKSEKVNTIESIKSNLTDEGRQILMLSPTEFKRLQKLLKTPGKPNAKLKSAAKKYKQSARKK